jgi:hypothetical protein
MELVVHERQQALQSRAIAVLPGDQQLADFAGRGVHETLVREDTRRGGEG